MTQKLVVVGNGMAPGRALERAVLDPVVRCSPDRMDRAPDLVQLDAAGEGVKRNRSVPRGTVGKLIGWT